jgi:hypothetical protein
MTHEELENCVTQLLIVHANNWYAPLTDKESEFVEGIAKKVGFKGYKIVSDMVNTAEARLEHEELMQQIKTLEEDYPMLRREQ